MRFTRRNFSIRRVFLLERFFLSFSRRFRRQLNSLLVLDKLDQLRWRSEERRVGKGDWSSDVCSSDLCNAKNRGRFAWSSNSAFPEALIHHLDHAFYAPQFFHPARVSPRAILPFLQPEIPTAIEFVARFGQTRSASVEIGRASCRER